jgi:hypothetical protein
LQFNFCRSHCNDCVKVVSCRGYMRNIFVFLQLDFVNRIAVGVARLRQWLVVVLRSNAWKFRLYLRRDEMRRDELGEGEESSDEMKFGVWKVYCEIWGMKSAVWSVKCEIWSVKEVVRSEKCGLWSVKCGVWSMKFGVRKVQCEIWSVKHEDLTSSLAKNKPLIEGKMRSKQVIFEL